MVDDEEKLQLRADVERFKRMIRQKDEMIEEMEHELSRPKTPGDRVRMEAREREFAGKVRDLQIELDARNVTIQKKDAVIDELRDEVDKLEKNNRELAYRPDSPTHDSTSSFLENEMSRMSEELDKFRETTSSLMHQNMEYEKEVLQLRSDLESSMEHVRSLESHLKTREEELERLEAELFELKASGHGKTASAGNSIFAEAMEAERKLEEDLKSLFAQNQCLLKKIRRLHIEKEDAEERAQSAMSRKYTVRSAINTQGHAEMDRLRQKVRELETERTHLWERLFVKLRNVRRSELGALVVGYHESFKLSIASVKGNHEQVLRENEELAVKVQGLERQNADHEEKIEQLKYDLATAQRKVKAAIALEADEDFSSGKELMEAPLKGPVGRPTFFVKPKHVDFSEIPEDEEFSPGASHPLLSAPLKVTNSAARSSFFVKPRNENIERSMMNMSMTPKNPSRLPPTTPSSVSFDQENISDFALRHQRAKAERKAAATPAKPQYNFVQLAQPTAASTRFKPATLLPPKPAE